MKPTIAKIRDGDCLVREPSEVLQERQKLVRRTIPTHSDLERLCFRQCLFFKFEIGMKIDLRGVNGLVSQPQRDYRAVHTALQKAHGGAVAQPVRGKAPG